MGVPTISLIGRHHASRVGLSLLHQVGMEVFVAREADEYVEKAVSFSQQLDALAAIRGSLRAAMLDSSLCDARQMGRSVAQALRSMWRRWCAEKNRVLCPG